MVKLPMPRANDILLMVNQKKVRNVVEAFGLQNHLAYAAGNGAMNVRFTLNKILEGDAHNEVDKQHGKDA